MTFSERLRNAVKAIRLDLDQMEVNEGCETITISRQDLVSRIHDKLSADGHDPEYNKRSVQSMCSKYLHFQNGFTKAGKKHYFYRQNFIKAPHKTVSGKPYLTIDLVKDVIDGAIAQLKHASSGDDVFESIKLRKEDMQAMFYAAKSIDTLKDLMHEIKHRKK